MPNGQDTEADELLLEVEDTTEAESDEDTQTTEDGEGESEISLETDDSGTKLTPAEENAKRQEESWLEKVVSGRAEVADAPKWLQGRLNSRLDATNKAPDTEEVVKKVMAQEREAQEFAELQKQIPRLTAGQAKELQQRFADLKQLGKVKALKTSLELMGLTQKFKEAEARGVAKGRMSLPQSGQPAVKKSGQVGGVALDTIHDDKKWNAMIRAGQGT
jgi:hypothetical protein